MPGSPEPDAMFNGHGPDFIYDTVALAISTIPVVLVAALLAASWLQEPLRVRERLNKK